MWETTRERGRRYLRDIELNSLGNLPMDVFLSDAKSKAVLAREGEVLVFYVDLFAAKIVAVSERF